MILRTLLLLAATTAMMSRVAAAPVHAPDRHVLHHCEDVLKHAAKTPRSTKTRRADAEVERCRIVVREFALRDSRMPVDQNGKTVR
jgi:hypothetical protein